MPIGKTKDCDRNGVGCGDRRGNPLNKNLNGSDVRSDSGRLRLSVCPKLSLAATHLRHLAAMVVH
jgi:hypothetical protein